MKTRTLCKALLQDACDDNVAFYRKLLEEQSLDVVKDIQWRDTIALARSLSVDQREVLLAFAGQVAVDAISTFCNGIDGTTQLGGEFISLSVVDADGQQHAGSLQDEFLSLARRQ